MECPKCKGKGSIEAHYEMSDPGSGRQRQRAALYSIFGETCTECNGTGKIDDIEDPNYIDTDDWLSQQFTEMRILRDENEALRNTLKAIINVNHNDDCLFCGFKDRIAYKALESLDD